MEEAKVCLVVSGMTCTNCALTVQRAIEKQGASDVNVNYLTGDVSFVKDQQEAVPKIVHAINQLGYKVESTDVPGEKSIVDHHAHHVHSPNSSIKNKFVVAAIFTLPLFLHMFLPFGFLHLPLVQLLLCLPVMYIGSIQFGKSAFYSLKSGVPNMDVLIITGSGAAFIYSVIGMFMTGGMETGHYLFFETAATIITLVLLGNLIEERSVTQTTSAIADLQKLQPENTKRLLPDGRSETVKVKEIVVNDIVVINTGDRIPLDGKIVSGNGVVNESMLTGESIPVNKSIGDQVTGGTILNEGVIQVKVEKTGKATTLSKIIQLVKDAQNQKPKIQKLGDKVSAVFVPVVVGIAVLTFCVAYFVFKISLQNALMQSIAVLVISCPCAMGLATPTAVMAGLGRAAKKGILIKGGSTLEELSKIKTFVFDKTGTLTTGNFKIEKISAEEKNLREVKSILFSLEQFSSHPIAKSIVNELKGEDLPLIKFKSIEEDKGTGINATDESGNLYSVGSQRMVQHLGGTFASDVYVLKNNQLLAGINLTDELKPDTAHVIAQIKAKGIHVVLLSGDRKEITEKVAAAAGIQEVYSEKPPADKLAVLDALMKKGPVAMIGDGINDAPALAKATVGISISDATDTAIQSAQIILLSKHNLSVLLPALKIGSLTYSTIRQNLFWAFFYNVIAIPIAAAGYLSPMIAALSMAFSDVVVIGNSLRLKTRKISND